MQDFLSSTLGFRGLGHLGLGALEPQGTCLFKGVLQGKYNKELKAGKFSGVHGGLRTHTLVSIGNRENAAPQYKVHVFSRTYKTYAMSLTTRAGATGSRK